jgi:hypothetical protein
MKAERRDDGKFWRHADGGYPILYLTKKNEALCADCANDHDCELGEPVAMDIFYEGDAIACDCCETEIESAYGPVEERGR